MTTAINEKAVPPMVENKPDAGPDDFFCDGCLAYHPPEYRRTSKTANRQYCKFAYAIVHSEGKTIKDKPIDWNKPLDIPEISPIPENNTTDTPPALFSQAQDIDEKAVTKVFPIKSTPRSFVTPKKRSKASKKMGRPKAGLPEEEIRQSKEGKQVLADRYGVSRMTIYRIQTGQGVLV